MRLFFLAFCIIPFTKIVAQQKEASTTHTFSNSYSQQGSSWQLHLFAGKNITHKSKHVTPESINYAVSLDYSRKTTGRNYWQFAHNYPQEGLQLIIKNFGNDSIYGHAASLVPYLEFNSSKSSFGMLQIKHGAGLAYVTKKYNSKDNPRDSLLSSHLNAAFILDFGYSIYLSNKTEIKVGLLIHHISNGGVKLPNYGMNTAFANVGIRYYPFGNKVETSNFLPQKYFKRIRYRLGTSCGFYNYKKDGSIDINPQASAMIFLQHNTRFRTGAGFEVGHPQNYQAQLALYSEIEVQFAHMVTRYGFAKYVINKRSVGEDFYSKIGIGYYPKLRNYIPAGVYVGALLKAHVFTAAHIELTTGYTF